MSAFQPMTGVAPAVHFHRTADAATSPAAIFADVARGSLAADGPLRLSLNSQVAMAGQRGLPGGVMALTENPAIPKSSRPHMAFGMNALKFSRDGVHPLQEGTNIQTTGERINVAIVVPEEDRRRCADRVWFESCTPLLHINEPLSKYNSFMETTGEEEKSSDKILSAMVNAISIALSQDGILEHAIKNGVKIIIHDFQMINIVEKLQSLLQEKGVKFYMPYVHHTAFPKVGDVIRFVPNHIQKIEKMCESLLMYDMVSVHTRSDKKNMEEAIAGFGLAEKDEHGLLETRQGKKMEIKVNPPGIDIAKFQDLSIKTGRFQYDDRAVNVLAVSRFVPDKNPDGYILGIHQMIKSNIARFKNEKPIAFHMVFPNPRKNTDAVKLLQKNFDRACLHLESLIQENDLSDKISLHKHSDIGENPLNEQELAAALRGADVTVFASHADGLNLTMMQAVASQDAADPGTIIASKTIGATEMLPAIPTFDPADPESMASALLGALDLQLQGEAGRGVRKMIHQASLAGLTPYSVSKWQEEVLRAPPGHPLADL